MIKIAFLGTPKFCLPFLENLIKDEQIEVSAIVSQPDKPVGRKQELTKPPVAQMALENNIPLYQPEKISSDQVTISELKKLDLDFIIIIAYGQIISEEVINLAKFGAINVHPSKLPKYRGPSPIQAALKNGDSETSISIMLIDQKMDHGPILAQQEVGISETDDYFTLEEKILDKGPKLLNDTIKKFFTKEIQPTEQNHDQATYCSLIRKEEGLIDPRVYSAEEIYNKYRAFKAWPGIHLQAEINGKEESVKLLKIKPLEENLPSEVVIEDQAIKIPTISGSIAIQELQIAGKRPQKASDLVKGIRSFEII